MDVLTLLYTVVFTVIGWVDGYPHTIVYSSVYSNRVGGWMSSHYCIIGWVDLRDYMNGSRIFVIFVFQFWTSALLRIALKFCSLGIFTALLYF